MSRLFNGSSQYLEYSAGSADTFPCTMVCWYKYNGGSGVGTLVSKGYTNLSRSINLHFTGDCVALVQSNSGARSASANGIAQDIWGHYAAVFASTTSRTAYMNGVAGTVNTVSSAMTVSGMKRTIGARHDSGGISNYANGLIAEAAIWDAVLSAASIARLAKGVLPIDIKENFSNLVGYWPLYGLESPELNRKPPDGNGYSVMDMTLTNAPTRGADHPPVKRFWTRRTNSYLYTPGGAAASPFGKKIAPFNQTIHRAGHY